ncbi:MAG: PSD1 and planctomycete cytochrome C domain-containing protein, partial [Planctomycetes bacterium]|nr:PSD1 and planctomycete cytochrome C domain-containing protein [Planctomycetota bacterium]
MPTRFDRFVLFSLTIFLCSIGGQVRAADVAAPLFEKDIQPILKNHCFACHGTDTPKAGLDLRTRAGMLKGGKSGPALKPGSIKESLIWLNVATDKMPADKGKLSDAEKDLLRVWIVSGAPGEGVDALKNTVQGSRVINGKLVKQGPAAIAKKIDEAIEARLKSEKQSPAAQADDAEFLRRAYVELNGRIPAADRVVAFLDDRDPEKRAKLIDSLLAAPEYGRYFGGLMAAKITVEEPNLRPNLEKWLAEGFNGSRGWDVIVRDLINANGNGPETSFVMSNADNKVPQPEKLAGAMARLFLGQQLQCAECHNHPFTDWKQTDFWAMAAFFSRTMVKKAPGGVADSETPLAKANVKKGSEPVGAVIAISATAGKAAGTIVKAKFLQGEEPKLDDKGPYRPALANWVTAADNPFFAEAAVNRIWAHFFGRGLVNPIDDMSPENPATHPEVLHALADEFRASGYDQKHLIRCICMTQAYQRTSRGAKKSDDPLFAHMAAQVMLPEALYDSLTLATGLKEIDIAAYISSGGRGGQPSKGASRAKFIRFFNTRELDAATTEFTHGIPQALGLLNSSVFNKPTPLVQQLVKD